MSAILAQFVPSLCKA